MSERSDAAKTFIENETSQHTIVVFSKTWCGYCRRTKDSLSRFKDDGVDVVVHELDKMDDGTAIQHALLNVTGSRTVPQVFVNGTYIGGNDVTQQKIADGTLLS
jgi:glutaredoxin 3